ncbi:MAG TPA: PAS domain S-box protein, partial [bacterium]|nr:PAS domain S-box protein [bacterium]
MEELTGVSEEDILGRGDFEYAIPFYGHRRPLLVDLVNLSLHDTRELYSSIRREGETLIAETYAPSLKGGCHLWCKATPLYDSTGQTIGAIESVRDVTDALTAKEALQDSEEKYRTLVENVNDGIAINQAGKFIYFNEQFASMLGYTQDELLMKDYREIFTQEGLDLLEKRQEQRNMGRVVPNRYETKMLRKDGTEIDVEANVKIINYKGESTTFAVCRDVTQRKKFEAQIQQSQKMESLGVLAGGIAHDFNNLLVGILGNASLSLKEIPTHSPARRCLEQIERSAQRAADLTNQLLAYSGRGQIALELVNLTELVEEMIGLLEMSISKQAVLHHSFAREMPSVEGDA